MLSPYLSIPATCALVYRAYSHNSLTPAGIAVAALTAIIHAIHPWAVFFNLLCTFFLAGTTVTKVDPPDTPIPPTSTSKMTCPPNRTSARINAITDSLEPNQIKKDIKSRLTLSSSGSSSGGEDPRTHIQVLANSGVASLLIILHLYALSLNQSSDELCWGATGKRKADLLLPVGILCNYAAVAADTFSSELGILSPHPPRLLTSLSLRKVPPGTNGGVTGVGILAGFGGAALIAVVSAVCIPWCDDASDSTTGWGGASEASVFVAALTLWGGLGSILDSLLGGLLQASVVDRKSGKVIEGPGGKRVLVHGTRTFDPKKQDDPPSRRIESGTGVLDNNGVNLLMAATMSFGGMVVMGYLWGVTLPSKLPR